MTEETRIDATKLSSVFYEYYRRGLVCETSDSKLSAGEYAVLQILKTEPGHCLLVGELTEKLQTTQPAVSQIVKRMEQKRLIRKECSSEDKRKVYVSPTAFGEKQFEYFHERSLSFTQRVIKRMEPGNGEKLFELLQEFLRCAEEEEKESAEQ